MIIQLYEKVAGDVEHVVKDLIESWDMWHFHEGVTDVVNGNLDHLNGIEGTLGFFTMIRKMYAHSVCLGVRRQVKAKPESISLMGILRFMKTNHSAQRLLSREKYRQWWSHKGWNPEYCDASYEVLLGDAQDIDHSIDLDIEFVKSATCSIEAFADKIVAHIDRAPPELPHFDDIDTALSALSDVAIKLHNRIGGDSLMSVKPSYIFHAGGPLGHRLDNRV